MAGTNRREFSSRPATHAGIRRLGAMLLPGGAAGRKLAISAGIDSLGTGLFFASFTLYFVGIVKLGAAQVAFASTAAGILALFAPVPLGRLADRLGPGRLYIGLLVLRGLGYCCYAGVSDFKGFLVLTVVLTAADRASTPLQQSVVRALIGNQDGTRTMAAIRGVRNVGLTAGFLLAAGAFATAATSVFTVLFVANGVSFLVAAAMVWSTASRTEAVVAPRITTPGPATGAAACQRSPFRDRWFVVFTIGNGILWLHDSVLIVLLPIWVIKHTAVSAGWVPVFMAVNTVLTAVLQVYVARFADGAAAANRLLGLAGLLLIACCGFLAIGQAAPTAIAVVAVLTAVILLSVAENLHNVAAYELSAELSPAAALSRYLGAFSLAYTGQQVIGPAVMAVLMPVGLIGWPVLAGAFGAAALVSRGAAGRCLAERAGATHRRTVGAHRVFRVSLPAACPA
ncbi:MFS transporter [Mycobacterium pseudokansasii]|uniref:MFS transporter n=1 Tax=Mycobacterium pseudokansasii TaxID=2341080 RepID=UPI0009C0BB41|nr:MFS transporter [Mycobacterium pseudokansasii]VAZ96468.1 Multidrug resistance protein MdtG [Mycobacterium pseudokansasii]VAZ97839.1 Multidrug resistance protein MdtG [Mycobacterium pseudokansasii]